MVEPVEKKSIDVWDHQSIAPGTGRNVKLPIGESYSGLSVNIPIHIRRAEEDGPVVFITAALHGDEINGTGAIRQLIQAPDIDLKRGSLILVPVLNVLGFDRHSRYLPDRRDLNRSFPGSETGSLAGRMARKIFTEIVLRSDYGIDLHTASVRRTNYPNVRGDMTDPGVKRLAKAFGSEVIIDSKGPKGALRREACRAGRPTIILEGGEVSKVEPTIVEAALRGIKNVLAELEMIDHARVEPHYQLVVKKSKWIRAERGGFLHFHVKPGDIVERGRPLATNTTLLGRERSTMTSPFDAVVIGMTTLPAVSPGEPICNLGQLTGKMRPSEFRQSRSDADGLEERLSEELASNLIVVEPADSKQQKSET